MSVNLAITHSLVPLKSEKTFDKQLTLAALKQKLEFIVGTAPKFQELHIKQYSSGALLKDFVLEGDDKTLEALGVETDNEIHVVDTDPERTVEQLTTNKEGIEIKPVVIDANDPRLAEVKQWKEDNLLKSVKVQVGERCVLKAPNTPDRRGKVAYVGKLESAPNGVWVGVELDEPLGKNDGSIQGVRYFTCEPLHGSFAKPNLVEPEIVAEHEHVGDCCHKKINPEL